MKCPKCGANMAENSLYCESCGEDIHIVPDFDPEVEYNLEQTLNDIIKDIGTDDKSTGEESTTWKADVNKENNEYEENQDWDEHRKGQTTIKRRYLFIGAASMILMFLILGAAFGISKYRHNSLEYQINRAHAFAAEEDYDKASDFYERALELDPDNIDLKFVLAESYFLKNNKIEYEYLLRQIVNDKNATVDQLESAYGKLIAIYRAREDYKTINELLIASDNESIMSRYQTYLAVAPQFSIKEGYYNSIQPLKLTTFGTGKIYYTLDGSEPGSGSFLYTAPILLEEGEYCVKAVYINELGTKSDVVTMNYFIEIEVLPSPEITVVSGEYNHPINIEVLKDSGNVYYTTDGSVPNADSNLYNGPIPMPIGESVYKFIVIEDGKSSEVEERTYFLKLNTDLTPADAVEKVVDWCVNSGRIHDHAGYYEDTDSRYLYEYLYPMNINESGEYYVIAEVLRISENEISRTGSYFAVDIYQGDIYKLQIYEDIYEDIYVLTKTEGADAAH